MDVTTNSRCLRLKSMKVQIVFCWCCITIFVAIAYELCLNSMDVLDSDHAIIKFVINILFNAFFLGNLFFCVAYVMRNYVVVTMMHSLVLLCFLVLTIYYKYFQTIPHLNMMQQAYLLPPVLNQIFHQLFGLNEVVISACMAVSLGCSLVLIHLLKKNNRSAIAKKYAVIFFMFLLSVYTVKGVYLDRVYPIQKEYSLNSARALKVYGIVRLYWHQGVSVLIKKRTNVPYPGPLNGHIESSQVRTPNKKNVIVIQIESLHPDMIDYRIGENYVMPFMHSFEGRCIVFPNFFAQHSGGGSSDAELASFTSLIPINTHSGFLTMDYARVVTLNRALSDAGYYCVGMHSNKGSYFGRTQSYKRMGFDAFLDQIAFGNAGKGFHSKDASFFKKAIDFMQSFPQPFFAYLITIQGHGPFKNHRAETHGFDLSRGYTAMEKDYILTMHEVDQALSLCMRQLEEKGFLKNTIVVMYSDHSMSIPFLSDAVDNPFLKHDRIPLFIIDPNRSSCFIYKVGSHIDIGPTILEIVGVQEPSTWLGSSMLEKGVGKALFNKSKTNIIMNSGKTIICEDSDPYQVFLDYSTSLLDP